MAGESLESRGVRDLPAQAHNIYALGRAWLSYPPAGSLEPCRCLTTASLSLGQAVDPEEPAPSAALELKRGLPLH